MKYFDMIGDEQVGRNKTLILRFSSPDEAIQYIEDNRRGLDWRLRDRVPDSWCSRTWGEEMDLLSGRIANERTGLDNFMRKLDLSGEISRPTWNMEQAGLSIDIGQYLSGQPEYWQDLQHEPQPVKHAEIWVNMTISGTLSQELLQRRGAGIFAAIEMLIALSYDVTLNIYDAAERSHLMGKRSAFTNKQEAHIFTFETSRNYSRDAIAHMLTEPAFYRLVMLSLQDISQHTDVSGTGHGHCANLILPPHVLHFPCDYQAYNAWKHDDTAIEQVKSIVAHFENQRMPAAA